MGYEREEVGAVGAVGGRDVDEGKGEVSSDTADGNREMANLVSNARMRMSLQHGHILGPWNAMSVAVRDHNRAWTTSRSLSDDVDDDRGDDDRRRRDATRSADAADDDATAVAVASSDVTGTRAYRVLDLGCGPHGEPGTTIARMLPRARVRTTDSCPICVGSVSVVDGGGSRNDDVANAVVDGIDGIDVGVDVVIGDEDLARIPGSTMMSSSSPPPPMQPPPSNLTKSILDMSDLREYETNSVNAITCCYGYGLVPDLSIALAEAHRVLVPGGILVVATWENSDLSSIGRDVLHTVREGGWDGGASSYNDDCYYYDHLDSYLPSRMPSPVPVIELSGRGIFEAHLTNAGFDQPGAVVVTTGTYPFDMGNTVDDMLTTGTILIRDELIALGAFERYDASSSFTDRRATTTMAGGWANLAEEAFWINIRKYADVIDGTMFLRGNTFKITVSTKRAALAVAAAPL